MAELRWGVWVPSYSWPDLGPEHVERAAALDREVRGARLRRLGDRSPALGARPLRDRLAGAPERHDVGGGADAPGAARDGHPGAARPAPGAPGQGDRDARPPVGRPLRVRDRPRLVHPRVRGDGQPDRGARPPHRRDPGGGDAPAEPPARELPGPLLRVRRRDHRSPAARAAESLGLGRLARPRSRRARRALHRQDRARADRQGRPLAVPLLRHPGVGQAGLAGDPGPRAGDRPRPVVDHLRALQLHPPGRHGAATPRRSSARGSRFSG